MVIKPTYDDANLILRLYEERREDKMRRQGMVRPELQISHHRGLQPGLPSRLFHERLCPHDHELLGNGGVVRHQRRVESGAVLPKRRGVAVRVGQGEGSS